MSYPLMKTSLAAALALALGAGAAAAAEATPAAPSPAASTPAAATPAAATPAPPTAAALGAAATILNDIGVKPSLDRVVPGMFAELQRQVLATHPELKDSPTQAVQTVSPDFVKTEQIILDDLAKFMAVQMTEQELKAPPPSMKVRRARSSPAPKACSASTRRSWRAAGATNCRPTFWRAFTKR